MNDKQVIRLGDLICRALETTSATGCRDRTKRLVTAILAINAKERRILLPLHGAMKRGDGKQVPLTRPTATRLVKEMRSAWVAVLEGKGNAFQHRVVHLALITGDQPPRGDYWRLIFDIPLVIDPTDQ